LALLVLLVVSPAAGALVLLAIGGFVAYRVASARQAADERGAPGLARAVARFRELAGSPPQPQGPPGNWAPEAIRRQATVFSPAEARRLGAFYRQLTDENDALDVLDQRPGALLLQVRSFSETPNDNALSPIFFDVGRRASQPIFDRFIWPPEEALIRAGLGAAAGREGEVLSAEFLDAQLATTQAAQAALLSAWALRDDVDWLMRPWIRVFGASPATESRR